MRGPAEVSRSVLSGIRWEPRPEGNTVRTYDTEALVKAAAQGDAAAWRALVERFSGLVWAVARARDLGAAEAEDVCQTVWFRLAEHIGRIRDPNQVGAWLATTARNEALKVLRSGWRVTPTSDVDVFAPGIDERSPEREVLDSEDAQIAKERARRLWQAFQELPARCRELLRVLVASPPPRYEEISVAFDMPIGSIGPTRARCLRRLRTLLAARGISERDPDA